MSLLEAAEPCFELIKCKGKNLSRRCKFFNLNLPYANVQVKISYMIKIIVYIWKNSQLLKILYSYEVWIWLYLLHFHLDSPF